jgi:hypothetical protein
VTYFNLAAAAPPAPVCGRSDYWHDRSPIERVEAIEFMRKAMFGNDRVSKRLQRVLTVVELKGS